jgi:hypothetical protein
MAARRRSWTVEVWRNKGDDMNAQQLKRHTERELETLARELEDTVPAEVVMQVGRRRFEALRARARIYDFIPLLVYRQTREELTAAGHLHRAA